MHSRPLIACALALLWCAVDPAAGAAQAMSLPTVVLPPGAEAAPPAAPRTPSMLDQLLAPVALYPDQLLATVLAAATAPVQVVEAQRWASAPAQAGLSPTARIGAAKGEGWDGAVISLLAFPPVLAWLDSHLAWTQSLGEAMLAQPADVLASVQRLRARAQAAGSLTLSSTAAVVNEGGDITITPADPQAIYVPLYDPWCVYGPWPAPVAAADGFAPAANGCGADAGSISYDSAIYLDFAYIAWGFTDWRHRELRHYQRGAYGGLASSIAWHPPHPPGVPLHGAAWTTTAGHAAPRNPVAPRAAPPVPHSPAALVHATAHVIGSGHAGLRVR